MPTSKVAFFSSIWEGDSFVLEFSIKKKLTGEKASNLTSKLAKNSQPAFFDAANEKN